jgi:hypothetical protein
VLTFLQDCILVIFVRRYAALGIVLLYMSAVCPEAFPEMVVTEPDADRDEVSEDWRHRPRNDLWRAKAAFLSELAASWSRVDRDGAVAVLPTCLAYTRLAALSSTGRGRQAEGPAGLYISLVDTWVSIAPEEAEAVILEALSHIRRLENPAARDFKFRLLATSAVTADTTKAIRIAEAIRDPIVRAWAFRSMDDRLAESDETAGVALLHRAIDETVRIDDGYERTRAMREAAIRLMDRSPVSGRRAFMDATRLVLLIEDPLKKARAVSDLAAAWARWDSKKPFELSALIPGERPDMRGDLFLRSERLTTDQGLKLRLLDAALKNAKRITSRIDRESLLASVAIRMSMIDPAMGASILRDRNMTADYFTSFGATGFFGLAWREPSLVRDTAVTVAQSNRFGHVLEKSRGLKAIGDVYAPVRPDKAAIMYESAFRLAVGE